MSIDEVLVERASIDEEIHGKTLLDLFERNAREHGDRPALNWMDAQGQWQSATWREYRERAVRAAMGLRSLGVDPGDFVAIMAGNRPEHVIADVAAMYNGATAVSLYNTLAPEQIVYVADNCGAKIAILENRDYFKRWEQIHDQLPRCEKVVLMEHADEFRGYDWVLSWDEVMAAGEQALAAQPDAVEERRKTLTPETPATVIYTSGTTGPPKGVVLTHRNILWELTATDHFNAFPDFPRGISYLPLAHVAERSFSHWNGINKAGSTYFCPEITRAMEVVPVARPQAFVAVPRVWEKLHAGLLAALQAEPDERKRKIALKAVAVGQEVIERTQRGDSVPLKLRLQHRLFDKLVYSKIREKIGLDACELALSGAAPIARDILVFFAGIGLPIHEVYGMSETTAVTHGNPLGAIKIGTVGVPLPGVECRIAEDGEVLVRGGNMTPGYHNRPEATAELLDDEGWVHTGDLGTVDADGYLTIVGRKKELIITAGGKNISPNNIEGVLKEHPLIGQVCCVGDMKPFISALIVLDGEAAPVWAAQHGVPFTDFASFSRDERVLSEVASAVEAANQRLAKVEQIKKWRVLEREWTPETEELTPTLKLKRNVIHDKYAADIESLYSS
ncbi:MAG TPA: long-chain fatty acid--CoA ligase [Egibacteraceae bacterium]|nr:long-chain fatty acid--CoA ligase [Egibacteraceae bacterium]